MYVSTRRARSPFPDGILSAQSGWTIDETHPSRSRCPWIAVRARRVCADHRQGWQRRDGARRPRPRPRRPRAAPAAAPAPTPAAALRRPRPRRRPRPHRARAAPRPRPPPRPPPPRRLAPTTTPGGGGAASKGVDLGISPTTPAIGGGTLISTKQAESLTATTSGGADEWKFDFHGYLSAPVHISFGPPSPVNPPSTFNPSTMIPPGFTADPRPAGSYVSPYPFGASGPSGTQWHSPTRVPGYLYTTWEFTNTVHGPWTQLNFTYGNSRAMATVIVDSYSQTDGGYKHLQAQQGIDQAFLTLNFPDALGDLGTLTWNIGTFQNRYGTMGKYDGGMYETYLFGRTHITGETLTANLTNIDSAGDWAISVEDGFGAKYDLVPYLDNPYYQVLSNYPVRLQQRQAVSVRPRRGVPPLRRPGPPGLDVRPPRAHRREVPEALDLRRALPLHLDARRQLEPDQLAARRRCRTSCPGRSARSRGAWRSPASRPGSTAACYGDGYVAWSHIDARNINALADSIEVIHSYGGYQFKQNFFGQTYNAHTGVYRGPQNETGTVDNLALPVLVQLRPAGPLPGGLLGRRSRPGGDGVRHPVDRRQPAAADRRRPGRRRAPATPRSTGT